MADVAIDETGMPTLFIVMAVLLGITYWPELPRDPVRSVAGC